ncbi:MAG TPA: hypothetical protein VMV10_27915 [Pirellulales bacterium]|nr:hypothetical protein [Pirellulales bacterium]
MNGYAIIDQIEAAEHVSAEEAIVLRAGVEKLAQDAPELAAPWDRAVAAQEAAELQAELKRIAASRASRWSDALKRFGDYVWKSLLALIPAAIATLVLGELAGLSKLAPILFLTLGIYCSVCVFGASGVWMILQAYLTFRVRLARGEKASAWSGLALRSLPGMFFIYLASAGSWGCLQGILR